MECAVKENLGSTVRYIRNIKCARHYVLKPGGIPFVMERNPRLKNISEANAKVFKIRLWRRKRDKFGNFIQNFKDYIQPDIQAAEARFRIYDKMNPICNSCRRCITA